MAALQKNIGTFPIDPKEQNSLWFKLYKKVGDEVTVSEAHRMFLLYRDMTTISALLLPLTTIGLYLAHIGWISICTVEAVLVAQFLTTAVAARHAGNRFVTNVLVVHSIRKVR